MIKNHLEQLKQLQFEQQLLMKEKDKDDDWIDDHQTIGDELDSEIYYGDDFGRSFSKEEELFFIH